MITCYLLGFAFDINFFFLVLIGLKRLDKKIGKELMRKVARWFFISSKHTWRERERVCLTVDLSAPKAHHYDSKTHTHTQRLLSSFASSEKFVKSNLCVCQIVAIGQNTHKHSKKNTNRLILISEKPPHHRYLDSFYL